jgi:phosphate transport system substrate-binding protein
VDFGASDKAMKPEEIARVQDGAQLLPLTAGNIVLTYSIQTTPGSSGYVEFGYALSQKMPMAQLENKSGSFITPSTASGQAAIASANLPDNSSPGFRIRR